MTLSQIFTEPAARLLARHGKAREATLSRRFISRAGFNPTIRCHIRAALARLDHLVEARKELQAALVLPAPIPEREDAQTLLAELGH